MDWYWALLIAYATIALFWTLFTNAQLEWGDDRGISTRPHRGWKRDALAVFILGITWPFSIPYLFILVYRERRALAEDSR